MIVCTDFSEEVILHGILQEAASEMVRSRRLVLVYSSAVFAVLRIGFNSVAEVIFVFMMGFVFALIADRTHSILGTMQAHVFLNCVLFLVAPFVGAPLIGG